MDTIFTAKGWKIMMAEVSCYAALLRRRGPHIALHSVCPSVCLSVRLSVRPVIVYILEHRSRVFVNLADVRYLLFCLHVRAAYSTAYKLVLYCIWD